MVEKLSTAMSMVVATGKVVAGLAICTLSGIAWAVGSVVGAEAADGYPEYYDAGNRAAFSCFLMMLIMICPAASLFVYGIARGAECGYGGRLE